MVKRMCRRWPNEVVVCTSTKCSQAGNRNCKGLRSARTIHSSLDRLAASEGGCCILCRKLSVRVGGTRSVRKRSHGPGSDVLVTATVVYGRGRQGHALAGRRRLKCDCYC